MSRAEPGSTELSEGAPGSGLRVPGSRPQAPGSRLQAPGSGLRAPGSGLQAAGCGLQTADCELRDCGTAGLLDYGSMRIKNREVCRVTGLIDCRATRLWSKG